MIRCILAAGLLTLCPHHLAAQDGAKPPQTTADEPDTLLVTVRATGLPTLLAQWPNTAVGRLAAEPEVAEAVQTVLDWHVRERQRQQALFAEAIRLAVELDPWQIANMFTAPDMWRAFDHPIAQTRRIDFEARRNPESPVGARFLLELSCQPAFEGRWTQAFRAEAALLEQAPWFGAVPDAKIGGFPAHVFSVPASEQQRDYYLEELVRWMQHMPGTFTYGTGQPDRQRTFRQRPDGEPQVALTMNLSAYVRMFQQMGAMAMPAEFQALGFDGLESLEWRARFVDDLLLDEFEIVVTDDPSGLVGALLNSRVELPPQALPQGAIAQMRTAIDFEVLLKTITTLAGDGELELPKAIEQDLPKVFTGGVALGICSPSPGGLIPRLLLTADLADDAAFDRVLQQAMDMGMPLKQVEYDGVPCTLLQFPNLPQGISPAFCKVGGRLHIAESGRSLRQFLKAQASGEVAMDVGDAPLPPGTGTILTSFDLRLDEVELYRSFRDIWLPLYALTPSFGMPPALTREQMPDVDLIKEHCGKSRGVLRRHDDRFVVQHLGALGGPELAALAMVWGPMFTGVMTDYFTDQLTLKVATHKLGKLWPAFESFRKREQRWPKDLAEFISKEKLAPDALLVPADDLAEQITLADGSSRRSSFRYFPDPLKVDANTGPVRVLLVAIRPQRFHRAMLDTDGALPEVYGEESSTPIDRLGK